MVGLFVLMVDCGWLVSAAIILVWDFWPRRLSSAGAVLRGVDLTVFFLFWQYAWRLVDSVCK